MISNTDKKYITFGLICFSAVVVIVAILFIPEPEPEPEQVPDEIFCIALFEPVCDIDTNTTYSNQCFATGAGAMNTVLGECQ